MPKKNEPNSDEGSLDLIQSEQTKSNQSPRITLRAGQDAKNHVFIEVEDNGPGIAEELLEEIFIPFFTTKPTGTGVGLSISKQIMQQHGGDIRVSSAPDGGARFVLEFSPPSTSLHNLTKTP